MILRGITCSSSQENYQKGSHANGNLQEMAVTSKRAVNHRVAIEGGECHKILLISEILRMLTAHANRVIPNRHNTIPLTIKTIGRSWLIVEQIKGDYGEE